MKPTSHLNVAIEQGYFVYSRKTGYATGQLLREYHRHQEQKKLPSVSVYLKSAYAAISIDTEVPLTEDQSYKIATYLVSKDRRKSHPHVDVTRTNFMYASRIPLNEAEEVARHIVSILREE